MNSARLHLRIENLTKRYGDVCAADRVSLDVYREEFVTLLGASGCGKTTTLMMIAGFTMPDEGIVSLDGEDITYTQPYRRNIGVVFQNYALFPHMNIYENIAFPLRVRKVSTGEIRARVEAALELVELEGYGGRYPHELSGGQQQRVALARPLVFEPSLLLMDEPIGALDKKMREHMQVELKRLQKKLKITVVYVTHDQGEALNMSSKIAIMRKGRLEQVGSPKDIYRRPGNLYVAEFIGETIFFEGIVVRSSEGYGTVQIAGGQEVRFLAFRPITKDENVTLMVRPEAVFVPEGSQSEENRAGGVVEEVIYMGEFIKYRVILSGGQMFYMKQQCFQGVPEYRTGDHLVLGWRIQDTKLL